MQQKSNSPSAPGRKNKIVLFGVFAAAAVVFVLLLVWLMGEISGFAKPPGGVSGVSSDETTVLSQAQKFAFVEAATAQVRADQTVTVLAGEHSVTISAEEAGAPVDWAAVKTLLANQGHDKAFADEYAAANPETVFQGDAVRAILSALTTQEGNDFSFSVEENGVLIKRGNGGIVFDEDAALQAVQNAFESFSFGEITLEATETEPAPLDWEALQEAAFVAPVDASFSQAADGTSQVTPHAFGRDVDMEAIQAELENDTWEQKLFPFREVAPAVTTDQVSGTLFQDVLGAYTTYYSESAVNRTVNVKLSAAAVNGTIILPGKTFSFNDVVGRRTAARGYKEAIIYAGDGMVDSLGGGICQVSSSLYAAALHAEMQQVNRYHHGFTVAYVPLGLDATIYWGSLDYVFRNNTARPIKIVATAKNGVMSVTILGTRGSDNPKREVKFITNVLETIPQQMIERLDPSKPAGYRAVSTRGSTGYRTETYKQVIVDGRVVETVLINRSHYKPYHGLVIVGPPAESTAPPETTTTPPETTTPPPETTTPPPETTTPPDTTQTTTPPETSSSTTTTTTTPPETTTQTTTQTTTDQTTTAETTVETPPLEP